jgi:hypothetical protein
MMALINDWTPQSQAPWLVLRLRRRFFFSFSFIFRLPKKKILKPIFFVCRFRLYFLFFCVRALLLLRTRQYEMLFLFKLVFSHHHLHQTEST